MLKRSFLHIAFAALGSALVLTSCHDESTFRGWEYMPDMYRGPAVETYQNLSKDGSSDSISAMLPVEGTIPRGFMTYQEFDPGQSGLDSARAVLTLPANIMANAETMEESKELYRIFCGHCHGDKGDGQGVLVKNEKFLGVPNYADRDINLGSIFHVVTYGKGVMGSHAAQLTPEERYKVALYVMQLRKELTGETEEEVVEAEEATTEAASDSTAVLTETEQG